MVEKLFKRHPEIYKYSHSAYSQPRFLFYGDSNIKLCGGIQQGHTESSTSSSDSIQNLIDNLDPKMNLWYLDDGNLGDDYRILFKSSQNNC